ncbi:hypothetical protein F2Q68_00007452 [Brassica cretica]|uniref:Uncharacterized protein n=1 Tax=Brassica cretica TaxID=69181 RepID=A0A8S9KTE5_BRACR|nr:hypothetical protein F2Q68_00007452 [Brassica cretica]
MFCYDKPIPEEIINKPVGLSISFQRKRLVIISDALVVKLKVHCFVQLALELVYMLTPSWRAKALLLKSVA